jgi:hypothetical protein
MTQKVRVVANRSCWRLAHQPGQSRRSTVGGRRSVLPKGGERAPVAWRTSAFGAGMLCWWSARDDLAVPARGSGGGWRAGWLAGLVPPQLEQVVGAAQQLPLRGAGVQPAAHGCRQGGRLQRHRGRDNLTVSSWWSGGEDDPRYTVTLRGSSQQQASGRSPARQRTVLPLVAVRRAGFRMLAEALAFTT